MRINSNYKDYYDHLQRYTFGQSKIYNRFWSLSEESPYQKLSSDRFGIFTKDARLYIQQVIVGFCGNIYSYKIAKLYEDKWNKLVDTKFIYSIDELNDFYKENFKHSLKNEDLRKESIYFFSKKDDTFFIKENSPIWICQFSKSLDRDVNFLCCSLDKNKNLFNEQISLSNLGFQNLVNDKTAWTELTSYVDFLGTQYKQVPEIENNIKIENHGFDKNSFRKKAK